MQWFFDNFPMFADSFRLVSIHCGARRLGACFLLKFTHRAAVPCDSTAFLFSVALASHTHRSSNCEQCTRWSSSTLRQSSTQWLHWERSVSFESFHELLQLTRMWANAQRDGRPAEHRWRPLFNAAKFGWRWLLDCRAVTLQRRAPFESSWGAPNSRTGLSR